MSELIPHWLEKQAQLNPDRTAIETPTGESITFSGLRQKSRGMAHSLIESGVKQGDHVALLSNNHPLFPVFIHAISYIGAVVVLLNTRLTPSELSYQLKDADVRHLYFGAGYEDIAEKSKGQLEIELCSLHEVPFKNEDVYSLRNDLTFDDVYTMMYTSGTTGKPKAVMHTYGNHWYSAVASSLNLGVLGGDKWLICLPLFHVGGFSILMKSVIYGMPAFLLEKFNESDVHEAIMEKGVTQVSVVSVMLQRLLERLSDESYPEAFRCMLLGGGPVPESLLQKASSKNIPVFQTYGMTETSSQIATLSPESAFEKLGSAGKALSLAELSIDSPKRGDIGEIIVRGPMVSKGYYNLPHRDSAYLQTGDLGYEDEDGFLYVVDRLKDIIITGGENVYPAEIESVLNALPCVREAGVTGVSDEQWGEVPVAFLVPEDDEVRLNDQEITNFCAGQLAKYKIPAAIHWIECLPRNASNKVLRRQLFHTLEQEKQR